MVDLFSRSDEFHLECPDVYGISSAVKPYKLAWHIDQLPLFKMERQEDIQNYVLGGDHTCFALSDLDHDATLLLVKNKGTQAYLYKAYKNFDYLLFSISPSLHINNDIIKYIKEIEVVTLCAELNPPKEPEVMNFVQLI